MWYAWKSTFQELQFLKIYLYLNSIEIMVETTRFCTKAFVGFFFWSNLHYKQSLYDWLHLHKKTCLMEIHTSLHDILSTLHQRIFIGRFKRAWEVKASPSRILFVFIDLSRHFTTTSILLRAQPNTAITKLGQEKKLWHYLTYFDSLMLSMTLIITFLYCKWWIVFMLQLVFKRKLRHIRKTGHRRRHFMVY